MVTILRHIQALLRLVRWPNLLIIIITQVLVRQCILVPFLNRAYMEVQLPFSLFFLLVSATVFISAGGYAINDYFDRNIDRINKPENMIVGKFIYPRHAMAYHLIFTTISIILALFVSYRIGEIYLSLAFIMVSGLLWFYSTTYKREFLLGNILVALLTACVPFAVLLFELPLLAKEYGADANPIIRSLMIWVLGFSFFAFCLNLVREIVKDCEDFEGDQAYGKKTIPVIWGIKTANILSVAFITITLVFLTIAWYVFVRDLFTGVYFLIAIIIPLLITIVLLVRKQDRKTLHKASLLLKITMLSGLGYMVVANLLMNYLK